MSTKTAPKKRSKLSKSILTLVTIGAIGAVGAFASTALLTDEVALPAVEAHGGTLDLVLENAASFSFGDLSNVQPSDSWITSKNLTLTNEGSIPASFKYVSTGTDSHDCYRYSVSRTSDWSKVVGWASPSAAQDKTVATLAPGESIQLNIAMQMLKTCTVGSGVSSGGSSALADRGNPHAEASLAARFVAAQA